MKERNATPRETLEIFYQLETILFLCLYETTDTKLFRYSSQGRWEQIVLSIRTFNKPQIPTTRPIRDIVEGPENSTKQMKTFK